MVRALLEEWEDIKRENLNVCQFPEDKFSLKKGDIPQIVYKEEDDKKPDAQTSS